MPSDSTGPEAAPEEDDDDDEELASPRQEGAGSEGESGDSVGDKGTEASMAVKENGRKRRRQREVEKDEPLTVRDGAHCKHPRKARAKRGKCGAKTKGP